MTTINQSCFMLLFCLINVYFAPGSCVRKGKQKISHEKTKRSCMPDMFLSFVLITLLAIVGQVVSNSKITCCPMPILVWFSFWLLIFNQINSSVKAKCSRLSPSSSSQHINNAKFHEKSSSNDSDDDDVDFNNIKPHAGMIKCFSHGSLTYGLGMFGFFSLHQDIHIFARFQLIMVHHS